MAKVLVVVDMQNDFVTGALRNEAAIAIVPNVVKEIQEAIDNEDIVFFTQDSHGPAELYLATEEGKNLPVPHCEMWSEGWKLIPEVAKFTPPYNNRTVCKETFGSTHLGERLRNLGLTNEDEVELIGVCTDICVISNALLLKAFLPNIPITVKASCCAGVTPESHENALKAMAACQIKII